MVLKIEVRSGDVVGLFSDLACVVKQSSFNPDAIKLYNIRFRCACQVLHSTLHRTSFASLSKITNHKDINNRKRNQICVPCVLFLQLVLLYDPQCENLAILTTYIIRGNKHLPPLPRTFFSPGHLHLPKTRCRTFALPEKGGRTFALPWKKWTEIFPSLIWWWFTISLLFWNDGKTNYIRGKQCSCLCYFIDLGFRP